MARMVENQLLLHQSNRTCITWTYWTFPRKKKCKGNVTKGKSPPLLLKKNKQTEKEKTKQNISLVSISNVGDQLWLGPRSQSFSSFRWSSSDVLIFRSDVLIFCCNLFLQQRVFVIFFKSEKVSDFYSMRDFVYW